MAGGVIPSNGARSMPRHHHVLKSRASSIPVSCLPGIRTQHWRLALKMRPITTPSASDNPSLIGVVSQHDSNSPAASSHSLKVCAIRHASGSIIAPVRIGWVISNQDVARLLTAVTWNTCLWGGRHNCIVPVHDTALADRLVSCFRVDVLLPVQPDAETTAFIERFPHLKHHRWVDGIFQWRKCEFADIRHAWRRIVAHQDSGDCSANRWPPKRRNMLSLPEAQAIFFRRRHQPSRSPLAKIRPGSPPPAITVH
jgi:hypothetical protein